MDDNKRQPPWTLNTIGEVIESMEQLKEKGLSDETPIVWSHLENERLLKNAQIENIMILDDWGYCYTSQSWFHLEAHNLGSSWEEGGEGQKIENIMMLDDFENDEGRKNWVEITLQERE